MANVINSLKLGDGTYVFTTPYATCDTAAATVAKVATTNPGSNFSLETGARITVKFTVTNTAANPTLNVNSTGAKAIYYRGSAISAGYLAANRTYEFVYNGTQYELVGDIDTDTNTNTSHSHDAGVGLVGSGSASTSGGTYTYKAKLKDETKNANDSLARPSANANRLYPVEVDKSGYLAVTVPWSDTNTDTTTTTGATDTSSKIFLVGATSQSSAPTTYSHDTAYVGTDGCLYSNSKKVATLGDNNTFTGTNKFQGGNTYFMTASGGPSDPLTTVDANGVHCQASGDDGTYYQDTVIRHKVFTLTLPFKSGILATLDDMPDKPFTAPLRLSASPKLTKSTGLGFRTVHFKGGPKTYTEGAIWTDGSRTYYSYNKNQYVLDPATLTWNTQTWSGLTSFIGSYVWSDGTNIYYSNGTSQYQLNPSTSTWTAKTWSGLTAFKGSDVWSDGVNIYAPSSNTTAEQWVLNRSNSSWATKTWSGIFTRPSGKYIWSDGTNIYYSDVSITNGQLVLDVSTSTWSRKTWDGTKPHGPNVWTDGTNIYYDASSSLYVLNSAASKWTKTTFGGRDSVDSARMWTDGTHIYYAFGSVLDEDTSVYCSMKSTG